MQKGVGVAHYVNVSWEKTFKLISSSKPWPKFSPCKSDTSQALSPDLLKKIPAIGIHTEKGLCHKLYRSQTFVLELEFSSIPISRKVQKQLYMLRKVSKLDQQSERFESENF